MVLKMGLSFVLNANDPDSTVVESVSLNHISKLASCTDSRMKQIVASKRMLSFGPIDVLHC